MVSSFMVGGCGKKEVPQINNELTPTEKIESKKVSISETMKEYKDDQFGFLFSYPDSLDFETQTPYPGGTIKAIGFRVDGITESQLLNNDLAKSLMQNDLYCNLDETGGSVLCTNKLVEKYTNQKGIEGYKISRDKTFYDEDGNETVMNDLVYAFPLKTEIGASTYKAMIFGIKVPSEQNLKILEKITNTVEIK